VGEHTAAGSVSHDFRVRAILSSAEKSSRPPSLKDNLMLRAGFAVTTTNPSRSTSEPGDAHRIDREKQSSQRIKGQLPGDDAPAGGAKGAIDSPIFGEPLNRPPPACCTSRIWKTSIETKKSLSCSFETSSLQRPYLRQGPLQRNASVGPHQSMRGYDRLSLQVLVAFRVFNINIYVLLHFTDYFLRKQHEPSC
jgi:hypothetical protein